MHSEEVYIFYIAWQTLFGLVWYRPTILNHASNHILEPDAKCFCDCRVPSCHFRELSVVHESEIFVALKREAYKDLLSLRRSKALFFSVFSLQSSALEAWIWMFRFQATAEKYKKR